MDAQKAAAAELARLGVLASKDEPPQVTLIAEHARTNGEVLGLQWRLHELEVSDPSDPDSLLYAGLRARYDLQRDRLARIAASMFQLGLLEQQVKIGQEQAGQLAQVIRGLLADLALSPEQAVIAPALLRWHLTALTDPAAAGPRPSLPAALPDRRDPAYQREWTARYPEDAARRSVNVADEPERYPDAAVEFAREHPGSFRHLPAPPSPDQPMPPTQEAAALLAAQPHSPRSTGPTESSSGEKSKVARFADTYRRTGTGGR